MNHRPRFKVLCAPHSFKESLSAAEAARAMAAGARGASNRVTAETCPVADGGEGTLTVLIDAMSGTIERATVASPLGEPREARYGLVDGGRTAIVELAEASGLALVPPHQRDPTRTTTFGTGQLIRLAADRGCTTIIVCVGGSATCDGGAGLAQALGARFYDRDGRLICDLLSGESLAKIDRFEPPTGLPLLRVAVDVHNPLCGPEGAALTYGPQKGATPEQARRLDASLARLASLVHADPMLPGAGAGGGAGFGLAAICGAHLERGADLVLEALDFAGRCRGASLVLTGEGQLDHQTLYGKAAGRVAAVAHGLGVPTIAIVGSTGPGFEECLDPTKGGFLRRQVSLTDRFGEARAKGEAAELIHQTARDVVAEELDLVPVRDAAGRPP